jgi:hypothetical protein
MVTGPKSRVQTTLIGEAQKTVRNEAQLVLGHVDRINPHESSTGVRMARISTWLSAWIRHGARVP